MKLATYNVNGVNGRLEVLLRWLDEAGPDVVCLQELKAPQEKFPIKAIEAAGYGAVWQGQIVERRCNPCQGLGASPHMKGIAGRTGRRAQPLHTEFRLPAGRGDEFAHGSGGPDSRDRPKPVVPRDMFTPDLHIDTLKVKSRNFQ